MSKKAFVRDAASRFMAHPEVIKHPPDQWVDRAIAMAEKLWTRLNEKGYGMSAEGEPRENKSWYSELQDAEEFDKAWNKFGKHGSKNAAAKAWIKLEESAKPLILLAIPRYIEQLHSTGTAKAHFATWLNDRRWESFDVAIRPQGKMAMDEKAQEIAGLRKQIEMAPNETLRKAFQEQLDRLTN